MNKSKGHWNWIDDVLPVLAMLIVMTAIIGFIAFISISNPWYVVGLFGLASLLWAVIYLDGLL